MVEKLEDHPFSSLSGYTGTEKPVVRRLDTSLILSKFSDKTEQAQRMYKQFVIENREMQSPLEDALKGTALGSDAFIKKITKKIKLTCQPLLVQRLMLHE